MTFTTLLKGFCFASICVLCIYACFKKNNRYTTMATIVDNEELKSRMDRIIDWVKTCDTKASIMLTLVCLVLSFIFTSDFVMVGFSKIIQSFRIYIDFSDTSNIRDISVSGVIAVVSMVFYLYFTLGSIYRLIMVLYSKINESLIEDSLKKVVYKTANFLFKYKPSEKTTSGVYMDSLIHFNNIANKDSFNAFVEAMGVPGENDANDLLSQIYINAIRCQEKFKDYNAAIRWMLYSIPFLIPLFVSISVFMTYRA